MSSRSASPAPQNGADTQVSKKKSKKSKKQHAAAADAAAADTQAASSSNADSKPDYEGAQISFLTKLLTQQQASGATPSAQVGDLAGMDRKARNKLEKKLRKALGLPKSDNATSAAKTHATDDVDDMDDPLADSRPSAAQPAASGSNGPSSAALSEWAAKSARGGAPASSAPPPFPASSRNARKRQEVADRYRLPPELHIPQELLLAHPVANARRVEKESKLFKYERNAPNYAERVARVRKEFLDSLPTATGAGTASGPDGNAATLQSGWDRRTRLVAEFHDEQGVGEEIARPKLGNKKTTQEKGEVEEEEQEAEEPAAKRSKQEDGSSTAAAVTPTSSSSSLPLLHESYHPRFVSSFTWLPEQPSLRKSAVDHSDPPQVLQYTASRMAQPGAPYPYARPALPIIFRPNNKGFEVDKPGIVALIIAARSAGVTFEEPDATSTTSAAATTKAEDVDAAMTDANTTSGDAKSKKSKKRKHAKEEPSAENGDAAAAASSSAATPADSASSSEPRIRFASYRNNFRKFFARRDAWRVDLQRVGRTIFLRRHLNYNYVNPFDVGHLFEQACKEQNVLRTAESIQAAGGIAAANTLKLKNGTLGVANSDATNVARKEDSTTHPYRAIVLAELREFDLLTSIEIDLYEKDPQAASSTPAAAASSSSSPSPSVGGWTLPPPASFPADRLSSFLELKTVRASRWDKLKKADVWVQTFLGGVPRTIVGFKDLAQGKRAMSGKELKGQRKLERAAAHAANVPYAYDEAQKGKGKESKRANQKAAAVAAREDSSGMTPVAIVDVAAAETAKLIDPLTKEQLMKRFYALLRFLAQHVKEGVVYKLEHRKREVAGGGGGAFVHPDRMAATSTTPQKGAGRHAPGQQSHAAGWGIFLEEIEGGLEAQPVMLPGMLGQVDRWVEEQQASAPVSAPSADVKMEEEGESKKKKKSKKSSSSSSSSKSSKKTKGEGEADGADEKKSSKKSKKSDKSKSDKKKTDKKSKKKKEGVTTTAATTTAADSDSD